MNHALGGSHYTSKYVGVLEGDLGVLSVKVPLRSLKELQLEEKLAVVTEEWADCQLTFAAFKNRGPIALKGGETSELMEKLEETQMSLVALTASRHIWKSTAGARTASKILC